MKNILFIVPTRDFQDPDYSEPLASLRREGHSVTVAATDWRCEGSMGTVVRPEALVRNVNPHDFDGLFIVGGVGARDLAVDISTVELVQEFAREKKIIAAIGNGVLVLAAADLLSDRYVSVGVANEDLVASKGAKLAAQPISVDGNIITAVGSRVAPETGQVLANLVE